MIHSKNNNKWTKLSLIGNILFLFIILLILILKNIGINILLFSSTSVVFDIFLSLFLSIGLLSPPVFLTIYLFKLKNINKTMFVPFIISIVLFYLASIFFILFLKIFDLRIFLISTIILVYYNIVICVKIFFTKYVKEKINYLGGEMPRFTTNNNEVKKIVEVSDMHLKALDKGFLIKVQTLDGQVYEGFDKGSTTGNNGNIRNMQYSSSLRLLTINDELIEIDFLDIKTIGNCTTPEKLEEYDNKGVIRIVNFDKE